MSEAKFQTADEIYPEAQATMELTQETHKYRSILGLFSDASSPSGTKPYLVYGDLLGAWGIEDAFHTPTEDKALFGHYIVERDLKDKLPEDLLEKVEFESEGLTFFGYVPTYEDGQKLMDEIFNVVLARDTQIDNS